MCLGERERQREREVKTKETEKKKCSNDLKGRWRILLDIKHTNGKVIKNINAVFDLTKIEFIS